MGMQLSSIAVVSKAIAQTAPTYYVATNGSDSNPGTIDKPLKTIQQGVNKIANGGGGNIYVRGGTYTQDSNPWIGEEHDGSANSRLVISAYQNEKVIIDGNSKAGSCFSVGGQYVDIVGFECRNAKTGIIGWGANNLQVLNNTVHDTIETGIGIYAPQIFGTTNIRVDGNKVYRTNLNNQARDPKRPGWGSGITISRGKTATVTNNLVYENYGEGITCTLSDNCKVGNNRVYDNYSAGMYMDNATNSVFENNLTYNTGNPNFFRNMTGRWQPDAGIALNNESYGDASNPTNNNIVRNNIMVGTMGLNISNKVKNTQIVNNTFYKGTEALLNIGTNSHENVTIANNIFYQTDGRPMVYIPQNTTGLKFQRNLWYGGDAGAGASADDVKADPKFVKAGGLQPTDAKLQAGSPAIDKGIAISSVSKDYFGTGRPFNNVFDIGAHEFNGK